MAASPVTVRLPPICACLATPNPPLVMIEPVDVLDASVVLLNVDMFGTVLLHDGVAVEPESRNLPAVASPARICICEALDHRIPPFDAVRLAFEPPKLSGRMPV